jgi:small multidrug resistance pump
VPAKVPPGLLLAFAIASEVVATVALRATHGYSRPLPLLIVILGYGAAFFLLGLVLRSIPVSVAYAVWSAVGTAAIAVIGMAILGEPVTALKVASLALIIAGVVGLNLAGGVG